MIGFNFQTTKAYLFYGICVATSERRNFILSCWNRIQQHKVHRNQSRSFRSGSCEVYRVKKNQAFYENCFCFLRNVFLINLPLFLLEEKLSFQTTSADVHFLSIQIQKNTRSFHCLMITQRTHNHGCGLKLSLCSSPQIDMRKL